MGTPDRGLHGGALDRAFVERLCSFARVVSFDRRGAGLSDSWVGLPTLVMHRRDDEFLMVEHSRYLAERIPGARYVELEGSDGLFSVGDSEAILGEIEEFLTGSRHAPEPDRVLATVLFTDICGSTERAAALGDSAWRSLLQRHDDLIRAEVTRHRGKAVKFDRRWGARDVRRARPCDLVVGSGIHFRERGAHELRGVPGEWSLYEVR